MTKREAQQILGLPPDANGQERLLALNERRALLQDKLAKAATERLRKKFELALNNCEAAYDFLELSEIENSSILFGELSEIKDSSAQTTNAQAENGVIPVEEGVAGTDLLDFKDSEETNLPYSSVQETPASEVRHQFPWFSLIVFVALITAGFGGWYFYQQLQLKRCEQWMSDIENFSLLSDLKEFRAFQTQAEAFVLKAPSKERDRLSAAIEALNHHYQEKRDQRTEILNKAYTLFLSRMKQNELKLSSARNTLQEYKPDPRKLGGTDAALWNRMRFRFWEKYTDWLETVYESSEMAEFYQQGQASVEQGFLNDAEALLEKAKNAADHFEQETSEGELKRYYEPFARQIVKRREWAYLASDETQELVDTAVGKLKESLSYLLEGEEVRKSTVESLQTLQLLAGQRDPVYVELKGELVLREWFYAHNPLHRKSAFEADQAIHGNDYVTAAGLLKDLHTSYEQGSLKSKYQEMVGDIFYQAAESTSSSGGSDERFLYYRLSLTGATLPEEKEAVARFYVGLDDRQKGDHESALNEFKQAALLGEGRAGFIYGLHLFATNQNQNTLNYIRAGLDLKMPSQINLSGRENYLLGLYFETKLDDPTRARGLFEKASEQGNTDASQRLAELEQERIDAIIATLRKDIESLHLDKAREMNNKQAKQNTMASIRGKYRRAGYSDIDDYIASLDTDIALAQNQMDQVRANMQKRSSGGGLMSGLSVLGGLAGVDPEILNTAKAAGSVVQSVADSTSLNDLARKISRLRQDQTSARNDSAKIRQLESEIYIAEDRIRDVDQKISELEWEIRNVR